VVVDVQNFVAAVEKLTQYVGQCKLAGSCHVKIRGAWKNLQERCTQLLDRLELTKTVIAGSGSSRITSVCAAADECTLAAGCDLAFVV
jgi:hypothetical protein